MLVPEFNLFMVRFDQTPILALIYRIWPNSVMHNYPSGWTELDQIGWLAIEMNRKINSHDKLQFYLSMNLATTSKIIDWQSQRIKKGLTGPKSIQELPRLDVLSWCSLYQVIWKKMKYLSYNEAAWLFQCNLLHLKIVNKNTLNFQLKCEPMQKYKTVFWGIFFIFTKWK